MTLYRTSAAYQTVGAAVANADSLRVTMAAVAVGIQTPAAIKVTGVYITVSRSVVGLDAPPDGSGIKLHAWDSSSIRRPYRWRSGINLNPHQDSFQVAKIEAEDYDDLTFRIFRDGVLVFQKIVTSGQEFVVNPISQNRTQIEIEGTSRIYTVQLAQRVEELSSS